MYRLFLPARPLQPYIECYWRFEHSSAAERSSTALEQTIFVDAKPDILFNFGERYQRNTPHQHETLRVAHLDSQRDYPLHVAQQGSVSLIGVRFYPGGLAAFLSLPMHELFNQVVALSLIFGSAANELEARLYDAGSLQRQITLLDHFFLQRLQPPQVYAYIRSIAHRIDAANGTLDISILSKQSGYSIRTLDRYFQQFYGVSPKFYARIRRFQHALVMLKQPISLAEIALHCGYYDQAHFTKEFSAFTGQSPHLYRQSGEVYGDQPDPVQFLQEA